jgi:hypothetical protein
VLAERHEGPAEGAGDLLVGALVRAGAGSWRFAERLVDARGDAVAAEAGIPDGAGADGSGGGTSSVSSVTAVIDELTRRLLDVPTVAPLTTPAPGAPEPRTHRRWWPWIVVGGAAAMAAIAIPLGVVYSQPAPSVGGPIGPLR